MPDGLAHVGHARRLLKDDACHRLLRLGRPRGVIASTDGDSRVAPTWLAATLAEIAHGADAVGGRIVISDDEGPWEIVGVSADVKNEDMEQEAEWAFYRPFKQTPWYTMALVVRAGEGQTAAGLAPLVRGEVKALDALLPVYNVRTMADVVDEAVSPKRLTMSLLAFFAVGALLLAAVGLYAVMSYAVAQRRREIGIRLALGAQGRDILTLVLSQGLVLTVIGLGLGLAGALAVTRVMASILYGVSATDPLVFGGVAFVLAAAALLACYVPARRATKVDPMVALRYE